MNNLAPEGLKIVELALQEDLGSGDVSAKWMPNSQVNAHITAGEIGVLCGVQYVNAVFETLSKEVSITWQASDGENISKGQVLAKIKGPSRAILSGERVALNFLQTLSSTATMTQFWVRLIAHTKTKLLDTRKTLPGLRKAQKYAFMCGGGVNHRQGLFDAVMLKENHWHLTSSMPDLIACIKQKHNNLPIIVEVENLEQLKIVNTIKGVDRILCDNFDLSDLRRAAREESRIIPLEASGGITQQNLIEVAETGVNYISTGAPTKNVRALDMSLLLQ